MTLSAETTWPDVVARIWESDPTARWFVYVLIVAAFGIVVWRAVRWLRPVIEELRDDVKTVKSEVKNDHTINLREEQDHRHQENGEKLDLVILTMRGLSDSVGSLQRGQTELYQLIKRDDARLDELEHTLPRARVIQVEPDRKD